VPIEREFKYVLGGAQGLYDALAKSPEVHGVMDIKQGYLSRGGRIRSRTWWVKEGMPFYDRPDIARVEYIFTYKHDLQNQPGCLEIETDISTEDYELAWSEADHKITKTRFLLPHPYGQGMWEIDFFKDSVGIYLALAEFEVPALSGPPDRLHPLVDANLIFKVPEDDSRFKNRKLCERELVEILLKEIA
jgi:hypothetical protein